MLTVVRAAAPGCDEAQDPCGCTGSVLLTETLVISSAFAACWAMLMSVAYTATGDHINARESVLLPRAMCGSVVLIQLGAVLMSVVSVTTIQVSLVYDKARSHVGVCGPCCYQGPH